MGWGHGQGRMVRLHTTFFFQKNMAVVAPPGAVAPALRHVRYQKQARSASDTRLHRAVPVTSDAHRARSLTCILTTDNDAALARCKCTVLYLFDALPSRATGDLRGIHKRTRLRRRIDAGGPLAGPPSRPGAPMGLPCCSAEASAEQFLWYNGGLSTLSVNATCASLKLSVLLFLLFLPNLCKKPGQKTPVRSQMAPVTVLHWWPLSLTPAGIAIGASNLGPTGLGTSS